jgi:hypothetical protein
MFISCKVRLSEIFAIFSLTPHGSAEGRKFIVKDMIAGEFDYQLNLQMSLASCENVRAVVDTVRELEAFIYPFLRGDLLQLGQTALPEDVRRDILQGALCGLAEMHDRDIVHNGKFESPKIRPSHSADCQQISNQTISLWVTRRMKTG